MHLPPDKVFGITVAGLVLLGCVAREYRRIRRMRRAVAISLESARDTAARASGSSYTYDKATYHFDSVHGQGLPEQHAYHHTTFFLSWLVSKSLMSEGLEAASKAELEDYRSGRITINEFYESLDCRLTSDMLSDEGNAFTRAYFDFSGGTYIKDYTEHLQKSLPSEFHVPYTTDYEAAIHRVIDSRFLAWREARASASNPGEKA